MTGWMNLCTYEDTTGPFYFVCCFERITLKPRGPAVGFKTPSISSSTTTGPHMLCFVPQPPPSSAFMSSFGILTPSVSVANQGVGSALAVHWMQELPGGQSSSLVKRMKVSSAVFVMDVVEKVRTVCVFLSEAGMHTQHVAGRCRDTQLSSVGSKHVAAAGGKRYQD